MSYLISKTDLHNIAFKTKRTIRLTFDRSGRPTTSLCECVCVEGIVYSYHSVDFDKLGVFCIITFR